MAVIKKFSSLTREVTQKDYLRDQEKPPFTYTVHVPKNINQQSRLPQLHAIKTKVGNLFVISPFTHTHARTHTTIFTSFKFRAYYLRIYTYYLPMILSKSITQVNKVHHHPSILACYCLKWQISRAH